MSYYHLVGLGLILASGCTLFAGRPTVSDNALGRLSCNRAPEARRVALGRFPEADELAVATSASGDVLEIDADFVGVAYRHSRRYFFTGERLTCVEDEYSGVAGPAVPRERPSRQVWSQVDEKGVTNPNSEVNEKFGPEASMYLQLVRRALQGEVSLPLSAE